MSPLIKEFNQMNVNSDPEKNKRLTDNQRIENLEGDVIHMGEAMDRLVEQNDKYARYLDERMTAEKENREFWSDVRKKLVTSGIWGTIVLIATAVLYAAKQWVETH
jgi:hypothetical protein